MIWPDLRAWVFSLKTFASAMLALWIALQLDLQRPYWAMATVYIVAQPLTGAMRSKAAYRFAGTLVGAIMTLLLVPVLVDTPVLLTGAFALWIGVCIYFAVLDRTPRAYLFLLAGYTVAFIGFPSVDAPGQIWYVVLARVEEITLGIACTTVIGSVVFPAALGPGLTARLDAWMQHAANWTVGVLSGDADEAALAEARQHVAGDAFEIGMLETHLAYDTSNLQTATTPMRLLRQRVLLLLPVVSGAADRIGALREAGALTPALQGLLDHIAGWIRGARTSDLAEVGRVQDEISALAPVIDAGSSWNEVLLTGLLERLDELARLVHDIIALRRQIRAESRRVPELLVPVHLTAHARQHRDHLMALHSAFASVLAVGVISAFWIAAAWPEGGEAVSLAAVATALFAAQDDPAPEITGFIFGVLVALVLDAVYLFVILPQADGFWMLVLALAPMYVPLGVLAAMPARAARAAGPIAFVSATLLALQSRYSGDFAGYVNGGIAAIVGLGATTIMIRIVRSVSAEWTASRLLRRNRADIARAALKSDPESREAFASLMVDRLSLVVPRVAASAAGAGEQAAAALADMRVGVIVVAMQAELARWAEAARRGGMAGLTEAGRKEVGAMLGALAAHFRRPRAGGAALRAAIDRAIGAVTRDPGAATPSLLLQLSGIRRALFPDAPPYAPESADGAESAREGQPA
jgi:uncharacterized membrane protein YccC